MPIMHGVLMVGPYDWEPAVLPEEEFRRRIEAFWSALADPSITGAVVFGDSRNNAELVYLTGFTPKVRQAMALVPRSGNPVVYVPGTRAGLLSAKRLTWVPEVELLSDPRKAVSDWLGALSTPRPVRLALLGGAQMRGPLRGAIAAEATLVDATAAVRQAMAVKSARELETIRAGCAILGEAVAALMKAQSAGWGVTRAVLEAERAAQRKGAQDVQTLFSLDGGRTLRPFEELVEKAVDPLQTYIAVRHAGFWIGGFAHAAKQRHAALERAEQSLQEMIGLARDGATLQGAHPLVGSPATSIGQGVDEPAQALRAGGVYGLHAGVSEGNHHAVVSAVVAVGPAGNEILWKN